MCLGRKAARGPGGEALVRPLPLPGPILPGPCAGTPPWAPGAPQKQGSRARCSHAAIVFSGSFPRLLGQKRLGWDDARVALFT